MDITKLLLLFSLSLTSACSIYAGEKTDKDKYAEYERSKIFNYISNALIAGKLGKSVPFRMAGIAWLGYQASNYTLEKTQNIITRSDLKLELHLPFYRNMKLDMRYLQEQYIKQLQKKRSVHKHPVIITLNSDGLPIVSPKRSPQKQAIKSGAITVEFKKTRHQQKELPESISFQMDSNPFAPTNTQEHKGLLSSRHVFLSDGIKKGYLTKIK